MSIFVMSIQGDSISRSRLFRANEIRVIVIDGTRTRDLRLIGKTSKFREFMSTQLIFVFDCMSYPETSKLSQSVLKFTEQTKKKTNLI